VRAREKANVQSHRRMKSTNRNKCQRQCWNLVFVTNRRFTHVSKILILIFLGFTHMSQISRRSGKVIGRQADSRSFSSFSSLSLVLYSCVFNVFARIIDKTMKCVYVCSLPLSIPVHRLLLLSYTYEHLSVHAHLVYMRLKDYLFLSFFVHEYGFD